MTAAVAAAQLIEGLRIDAVDRLAGNGRGSLFSSSGWLDTLQRTYGFAFSASVLNGSGSGPAILFSEIEDLKGERIVSLPFSDYCDPLIQDEAGWNELIAPVLARGVPVTIRCLRNACPAGDPRFKVVGRGMWHGVDLERPVDEIWAALPGPARQNIRKAQRGGVTVRASSSMDDVRSFHRMHCHVRKSKYGLLAQPMAFFENLNEVFGQDGRLSVLLAELDGQPIAGILFLEHDRTLYYKFNASVELALRPNDLLLWEGIKLGAARGLELLDFGFSDIDQPGLVRYKQKYATEERFITVYRYEPPGWSNPRGEAAGRAVARMAQFLADPSVPDAVSRRAGDEFYRYFC